jgi:hypothetical protein
MSTSVITTVAPQRTASWSQRVAERVPARAGWCRTRQRAAGGPRGVHWHHPLDQPGLLAQRLQFGQDRGEGRPLLVGQVMAGTGGGVPSRRSPWWEVLSVVRPLHRRPRPPPGTDTPDPLLERHLSHGPALGHSGLVGAGAGTQKLAALGIGEHRPPGSPSRRSSTGFAPRPRRRSTSSSRRRSAGRGQMCTWSSTAFRSGTRRKTRHRPARPRSSASSSSSWPPGSESSNS